MSFLPVSILAVFPASAGLFFGIVAYIISVKQNAKKRLVYTVIVITIMSLAISLFSKAVSSNEIVVDEEFEEIMEISAEEAEDDILEALEEIEIEDLEMSDEVIIEDEENLDEKGSEE